MRALPRYPVYIISKGRADACLTGRLLMNDRVPFRLVIEPQELDAYAERFDPSLLLVLPFANLGLGSIPARNWVWQHALDEGAERHWILDDNMDIVRRCYRGHRIPCDTGVALRCVEDFVDRYSNVAVAGLAYQMFGLPQRPPIVRNVHVYSCLLIENSIPQRWRGRYNEDTDLCLQVLASGLCTVLVHAFVINKMTTMTMRGGNTDELYADDGRLRMARELERVWPGVVRVTRRYKRPQHIVQWTKFDTPLKLKPGVDLDSLEEDEYGLLLNERRPVSSAQLRRARDHYHDRMEA